MMDVVFDMETNDPDDFLTLLLLLDHPAVRLRGVTVMPGSPHQIGLVRAALGWFGAELPVGAWNLDHPKECVSSWHRDAYGPIPPSRDAVPGGALLRALCGPDTTLVTGAPLKNLGAAMSEPGFALGRWVAQGGFAGEGVVPPERQLEKFRGLETCPTFNLNGTPKATLRALEHPGIGHRRFVSKNVCHGVVYDEAFHARLAPLAGRSAGLERIHHGMGVFLDGKRQRLGRPFTREVPEVRLIDRHGQYQGVVALAVARERAREEGLTLMELDQAGEVPAARLSPPPDPPGKKLHDPLAACCAIDPDIGQWAEVELFRQRGQWGSRLSPGSGTWIITDYDPERFFEVFTAAARP